MKRKAPGHEKKALKKLQKRAAEPRPRYQVPSGPPPGEPRDERIVYGAGCTWWGTAYEMSTRPLAGHDMPCCPFCGGLLHETPEGVWNRQVQEYAEKNADPLYPAFTEWNHNRSCLSLHPEQGGHTAFARLRAQFEAERAQGGLA